MADAGSGLCAISNPSDSMEGMLQRRDVNVGISNFHVCAMYAFLGIQARIRT